MAAIKLIAMLSVKPLKVLNLLLLGLGQQGFLHTWYVLYDIGKNMVVSPYEG